MEITSNRDTANRRTTSTAQIYDREIMLERDYIAKAVVWKLTEALVGRLMAELEPAIRKALEDAFAEPMEAKSDDGL